MGDTYTKVSPDKVKIANSPSGRKKLAIYHGPRIDGRNLFCKSEKEFDLLPDVYFDKKLMVWAAIGGENIDFNAAYNNLKWDVPWVSKSLPGTELLLSVGFRFYW